MIDGAIGHLSHLARRSRGINRFVQFNPVTRNHVKTLIESGSPEEVQDRLIQRTIRWASKTEYGQRCGRPGSLDSWPELDKTTIRDAPNDFIRRGAPSLSASTGGTTGTPLLLRRSFTSITAEQVYLDMLLHREGTSFRTGRFAVLRGEDVKPPSDLTPPFGQLTAGGRRLSLSSQHLNSHTANWYVEAIDRFQPDFLWAYPSTISSLARLVSEAGLSIQIPLIVCSSEMLGAGERAQLSGVFGSSVLDYYGLAERVALAVSHTHGVTRFIPTYGKVELRPLGTTEDGFGTASIIASGLWNRAMPLIRYRTGDEILFEVSDDPCQLSKIESGKLPFHSIRGRVNDFLVSPDSGILVGIDHLARSLRDVVRLQVIQHSPTSVTVFVMTSANGFTPLDRSTLDSTIAQKIPSSISVTIREVSELERSASGKVPFVIRRRMDQ